MRDDRNQQRLTDRDRNINLWAITGCIAFCLDVGFFETRHPLFLIGNLVLIIPIIWRRKHLQKNGFQEVVSTLNLVGSEFKDTLVFPPIKQKLIKYAKLDWNKGNFKLDPRCSGYKEMTYRLVQQEAQAVLKSYKQDSLEYIRLMELIAYINGKLRDSSQQRSST